MRENRQDDSALKSAIFNNGDDNIWVKTCKVNCASSFCGAWDVQEIVKVIISTTEEMWCAIMAMFFFEEIAA